MSAVSFWWGTLAGCLGLLYLMLVADYYLRNQNDENDDD